MQCMYATMLLYLQPACEREAQMVVGIRKIRRVREKKKKNYVLWLFALKSSSLHLGCPSLCHFYLCWPLEKTTRDWENTFQSTFDLEQTRCWFEGTPEKNAFCFVGCRVHKGTGIAVRKWTFMIWITQNHAAHHTSNICRSNHTVHAALVCSSVIDHLKDSFLKIKKKKLF